MRAKKATQFAAGWVAAGSAALLLSACGSEAAAPVPTDSSTTSSAVVTTQATTTQTTTGSPRSTTSAITETETGSTITATTLPSTRSSSLPLESVDKQAPAPGSEPSSATSAAGAAASTRAKNPQAGDFGDATIAEVYRRFQTLAPRELFEKFDSCHPNGVPNSFACSSRSTGQFQFFASDAKAATMTQLLTELRSSRVVADSGNKVVGWTTTGTVAVITVVDNENGLVLQQMVSSDSQDPREIITQLGLAPAAS